MPVMHTSRAGGAPPQRAREGLERIGQRSAADAAGFTVRNISEHLDEFAQGVPQYGWGMPRI